MVKTGTKKNSKNVEKGDKQKDILKLYSLDGCPWCIKAEALLKKMKVPHKVIEVTYENKDKYKKDLDRDTFPQLVLGDAKLGGYDELEQMVAVCELLKKAGLDARGVAYICGGGI